jgi:hypothetical protein
MSEFSESYHLRSDRLEDAVELLKRAGLKGFVYPPGNGWVTFLAEDASFEPDPRVVAAARSPLLHYVSAEDHGWSFCLFEQGQPASRYNCDWNDDVQFDDTGYSRPALERIVPSVQRARLDELEQHLRPEDFDDAIGSETAKILAEAVNLENYDWLSYDYLDRDLAKKPGSYPNVTKVG